MRAVSPRSATSVVAHEHRSKPGRTGPDHSSGRFASAEVDGLIQLGERIAKRTSARVRRSTRVRLRRDAACRLKRPSSSSSLVLLPSFSGNVRGGSEGRTRVGWVSGRACQHREARRRSPPHSVSLYPVAATLPHSLDAARRDANAGADGRRRTRTLPEDAGADACPRGAQSSSAGRRVVSRRTDEDNDGRRRSGKRSRRCVPSTTEAMHSPAIDPFPPLCSARHTPAMVRAGRT